jgi:NADH-quinone oxidoreductase subunit M
LASLGLPGTSGFPAELLLLLSALGTHTGAGLAALFGSVVAAGYFLGLYRRAFQGPAGPLVAGAADLRPRELAVAGSACLLVLALGLYPQGVLDLTRSAAQRWVAHLPATVPSVTGATGP